MAPCNSSVSSPPLGRTAMAAATAGGATPPPPYPAYEKSMAVCAPATAAMHTSGAAARVHARALTLLFLRWLLVFGLLAQSLRLNGLGRGNAPHALACDGLYLFAQLKALLLARQATPATRQPAFPARMAFAESPRVPERPPRGPLYPLDTRSPPARAVPGWPGACAMPDHPYSCRTCSHPAPLP